MGKKIYHVSYLTWVIAAIFIIVAAFFVIFVIVIIPQILTMDDLFLMLLLFLVVIASMLFVIYGALIFFDFSQTRLELSDEGVVFYSTGYRIYTPWENIAGIGWTRLSRSFPSIIQFKEPAVVAMLSFEQGKLSRRPVTEKRSWWMLNRQLKAEDQYTQYIRIPVLFFRRKDKQEGSINQYLQYYLPQIMENR